MNKSNSFLKYVIDERKREIKVDADHNHSSWGNFRDEISNKYFDLFRFTVQKHDEYKTLYFGYYVQEQLNNLIAFFESYNEN